MKNSENINIREEIEKAKKSEKRYQKKHPPETTEQIRARRSTIDKKVIEKIGKRKDKAAFEHVVRADEINKGKERNQGNPVLKSIERNERKRSTSDGYMPRGK